MTTMTDKTDKLKKLDNSKLLDVVKNYRQYGYDLDVRNNAIEILNSRGVSTDFIKFSGNYENEKFNRAEQITDIYSTNSKLAFFFYCISFVLNTFVLSIDTEALISNLLLILAIIMYVFFFVFLFKASANYSEFYKTIGKEKGMGEQIIFFLIGMPVFFVAHLYFIKQMKTDLKGLK